MMLKTVLFLTLCSLVPSSAFATWSVIAVDRSSGTVVIASATCVAQAAFASFPAKDLRDVQAIVVPGKGVAAAQASVDSSRANQKLIFAEIQKGTPPAEIIALLKQDPQMARRQFAIVDLQGRSAGFSGERNMVVSLDRQGQIDGTGIHYSIQGNILASEAVVTKAVDALVAAKGPLADRVMAAMEAADAAGGDSRCSCDRGPRVNAPCTTKTAHVAYILEAANGDTNGESYNDGKYSLYVAVSDQDITPEEDANPVKTLRMRYERARRR
jgi:uncharacterized Ntn-hydrolase superfamily protein